MKSNIDYIHNYNVLSVVIMASRYVKEKEQLSRQGKLLTQKTLPEKRPNQAFSIRNSNLWCPLVWTVGVSNCIVHSVSQESALYPQALLFDKRYFSSGAMKEAKAGTG